MNLDISLDPREGPVLYMRELAKPDGRKLLLYGRKPISEGIEAPSPQAAPLHPQPHLRWHPVRSEWVAFATHRQNRTFLPPPEYSPLKPSSSKEFPTELPEGDYDIGVFENLFPSLHEAASEAPDLPFPTRPAKGVCEVVVFTQDPNSALGKMSVSEIDLLLRVWADRTTDIGRRPDIRYVMPFENRGVEVGVTLHHPHGQIYAYPFVPPVPARMIANECAHFQAYGRGLIEDMIASEIVSGERLICTSSDAVAFVPMCARYPYEVWVMPRRRVGLISDLNGAERLALARTLKTVLMKYEGLWQRPFPYLMVLYQAPTDERDHPESHLRFEFYPPYRSRERLKFLAGTELGAGMFVNDSVPEEKARELQAVEVSIDGN